MRRLRDIRLEDQVTEARDAVEDGEFDIGALQIRIKNALKDIAKHRYTRDDRYLGRAMAMLESSLAPQDIKEGDYVSSILSGSRRLEEITPSGMAIVEMNGEDTMRVPMHTLTREV